MSVNWSCPTNIPGHVAMGVQAVLSSIGAFELTKENLEAFLEYNRTAKILMWHEDDGSKHPLTKAEANGLIGFKYHY